MFFSAEAFVKYSKIYITVLYKKMFQSDQIVKRKTIVDTLNFKLRAPQTGPLQSLYHHYLFTKFSFKANIGPDILFLLLYVVVRAKAILLLDHW